MKLKSLLIAFLILASASAHALTNSVDVLKANKVIVGDVLSDSTAVLKASKTVTANTKSVFFSSDDGVGAVSQFFITPKHIDFSAPAWRFYSQAGNPQIITTNSTGSTIYAYDGTPIFISGATAAASKLTNINFATMTAMRVGGLLYPTADSTTNFVMVTDGAGTLSFRADVQASITNGFITGGAFAYTNVINGFLTNQIINIPNAGTASALKINFAAGGGSGNYLLDLQAASAAKYRVDGRGVVVTIAGNSSAYLYDSDLGLNSGASATVFNTASGQGANLALGTAGGSATTNATIVYGNGIGVGELTRWDKRGMKLGTNGVYMKTWAGGPVTTNFGTVAQNQGVTVIEGVVVTDAALGDPVLVGLPLQYTNYPLLTVVGTVTAANTVQLRAVNFQTVGNYVTTNDVLNIRVAH